jgi:hypothetical protein
MTTGQLVHMAAAEHASDLRSSARAAAPKRRSADLGERRHTVRRGFLLLLFTDRLA